MRAGLLLALLIVASFWKLVFTRSYTFLEAPDIANQVLPWLQVQALALRSGSIALWDPYQFGGQPLVGQLQPGVTSPFTYLLMALPMRGGYLDPHLVNYWFVALHVIAGLFAWRLLLELLPGNARAALFGGLFYATAGYIGNTTWPSYLGGAIWFPLIALFGIRGNAPLTGLFLGLAWMSGHHQVPLFATLAGAALLFCCRPGFQRNLRFALTAGIIAALVSAVQLLPAIEYGRMAVRWVDMPDPVGWGTRVPYIVHERNSATPADVLQMALGGPVQSISQPFAGWVAVALAALAIASRFELAATRAATLLGAGSLVFALGSLTPFHGVLYALTPMLDKARSPAVALSLTHLAVTILATIGFTCLPRAAMPVAFVLLMWDQSRVLGADYRRIDDRSRLAILPRLTEETRDVAEFLRRQPAPFRIEVDYEAMLFNFGPWHGLEAVSGYLPGVLASNHRLTWWSPRVLAMWGVTYTVAQKPLRPDQKEIFAGAHGWKVYSNPAPFPRAWTVHETEQAPDVEQAARLVRDGPVDLRRKVVLAGPAPSLEQCPGEDRIDGARVDMACRGMLVVAETMYPGWEALVDGRPAKIWDANTALRGVMLEAGRHEVTFRYRPWSVYVGLGLTLVGLGAALSMKARHPARADQYLL